MISIKRMKIDLLVQLILLAGLLAVILPGLSRSLWVASLALLGLWQAGSALQLAIAFDYKQRHPFIWAYLLLALLLPLGLYTWGLWALAPFGIVITAYFRATLRDTLSLLQRPRSFWDL
ncbi:MAG: hypothetical protein KDC66_20535 [Phaeodactylibacter sp.]|nr:hypothetical protein [Phaeodactylibacter sp.]MCB9276748.1 hypothetical protein [Lewinellaceae bacterium]